MQSSQGEIKIHQFLEYGNVPFEEEYEFDDLVAPNGKHLRFDFAVFDENGDLECLIEFQGRQHYIATSKFGGAKGLARQRFNDNLKRQYCLKNNIRLISIPYTEESRLTYDSLMSKISLGY